MKEKSVTPHTEQKTSIYLEVFFYKLCQSFKLWQSYLS